MVESTIDGDDMWVLTLPFKEGFITETIKDEDGNDKEVLANASLKLAYELSLEFLQNNDLLPKKPDDVTLSEWVEKGLPEALKTVIEKAESPNNKSSGDVFIDIPDNLLPDYVSFINISGSLASKPMQNRFERRKAAKEQRKQESYAEGLARIRAARGQKTTNEKLAEMINTPLPSVDFLPEAKSNDS